MGKIILKCNSINDEGIGVSTYNNLPIYIPNFLTGEEAQIQIVHKGYQKYFGKVIKFIKTSNVRINPECCYYGVCGGCQLQHMSYDAQLNFKINYVKELFSHYNLAFPFEGILKADNPLFYRHKVLAPIENNVRGFYKLQTKEFVKIKTCLIENYSAQKIINKVLSFNLSDLTYIYVRVGKYVDNVLLTLVTHNQEDIISKEQIEELIKEFSNIKTITQSIKRTSTSGKVLGEEVKVLYGKGYIQDKLLDVTFNISTNSFYQINPTQTEVLYKKALEYASLSNKELVLDAYCGVGTIGLCASKKAKHVIGVEIVSDAIKNAKENAKINKIENVEFICKDAKEFIKTSDLNFDVIFVDPPRKGCDKEFLETIMNADIKKIVYISCDPKSLVRDLDILMNKYEIVKIELVDLFPNTTHIESIALLELKSSLKV